MKTTGQWCRYCRYSSEDTCCGFRALRHDRIPVVLLRTYVYRVKPGTSLRQLKMLTLILGRSFCALFHVAIAGMDQQACSCANRCGESCETLSQWGSVLDHQRVIICNKCKSPIVIFGLMCPNLRDMYSFEVCLFFFFFTVGVPLRP